MTWPEATHMNDGATFTAQLTGGVRRIAALAHSVRDDDTVLRALRYELYYALDVDDVRFEPRHDPTWPSLPLIVDNRRRGVLVFVTHPPRRLSEDEIDAAAALIETAAAVLALLEARHAARIDSLTGALNHGAMLARLEEEIDRCRRYRTGLACLLIDLDDFKAINDRWGHATGDSVLRQVAMLLRTEFRAHDQVARYGGDEFVVLLPHAAGPRAEIAARRALRRLRDIHVVTEEGRQPLSASIGLAEWAEPETPAELLAKADQALLAGKRGGKDQLRTASGEWPWEGEEREPEVPNAPAPAGGQ
ncbi:MAG TPA: GGDEF domain-containing protein [Solirubrobacteraceae bacterium]|nr:GGDEF domain-containing protein [Solirubrobacteraceae bacterium]